MLTLLLAAAAMVQPAYQAQDYYPPAPAYSSPYEASLAGGYAQQDGYTRGSVRGGSTYDRQVYGSEYGAYTGGQYQVPYGQTPEPVYGIPSGEYPGYQSQQGHTGQPAYHDDYSYTQPLPGQAPYHQSYAHQVPGGYVYGGEYGSSGGQQSGHGQSYGYSYGNDVQGYGYGHGAPPAPVDYYYGQGGYPQTFSNCSGNQDCRSGHGGQPPHGPVCDHSCPVHYPQPPLPPLPPAPPPLPPLPPLPPQPPLPPPCYNSCQPPAPPPCYQPCQPAPPPCYSPCGARWEEIRLDDGFIATTIGGVGPGFSPPVYGGGGGVFIGGGSFAGAGSAANAAATASASASASANVNVRIIGGGRGCPGCGGGHGGKGGGHGGGYGGGGKSH